MLENADWSAFDSALAKFSEAAASAQALVNVSDSSVNDVLVRLDRQVRFGVFGWGKSRNLIGVTTVLVS
jgi:hypothetical protein